MNQYDGIVEVVKCDTRKANYYLERGYKLLRMDAQTFSDQHNPGDRPVGDRPQYFVKRVITFVVGRTADVPQVPMPERDTVPALNERA